MKDCRDIQLQLASLAADELAPADAETVIAHLTGCAACRAELQRERELRTLLGALPRPACPPQATAAVEAAARRAADAEASGRRVHGVAGAHPAAGRPDPWRRRMWAGTVGLGLAATLAALVVLPGRFAAPPSGPASADAGFSADQMASARRDVIYSLTLTARILDRTGLRTMNDVFTDRLPAAVSTSLQRPDNTPQGG